jgi:hypothetical protein
LTREMAVEKHVRAVFVCSLTESTCCIMRPAPAFQVVSSETALVHDESHEEFTVHGGLRFPDCFGASKPSSRHKEHMIGRANGERSVSRAAPNSLVWLLRRQCSISDNVP